ncbi:hypothetical protein INR49_006955 [Caranx melampygus]|nr:hypothetical protein INR49_006955 [Caranx melampygus]
MALKDNYVSVHMVDSPNPGPEPLMPRPPGLGRWQRRVGATQTVLLLLVSVSLCGVVIEACFIYRLLHPQALLAGQEVTSSPEDQHHDVLPSKPAAHLTDGQDVVHGPQVMSWAMSSEPLLYQMLYKDGRLLVQREGYYYIYSKVFFSDSSMFHHSINMQTSKYTGGSVTLLQARKYSSGPSKTHSNSYLGGVFHLYTGDAVYVSVSNTSNIERHGSCENIFGAFMI